MPIRTGRPATPRSAQKDVPLKEQPISVDPSMGTSYRANRPEVGTGVLRTTRTGRELPLVGVDIEASVIGYSSCARIRQTVLG